MSNLDVNNYMAIMVLEQLGIVDPAQDKIDMGEQLLLKITNKAREKLKAKLI